MPPSLAGDMSVQTVQSLLKQLLLQESSSGRASEEVSQKIQNLQGLCAMSESNSRFNRDHPIANWRRQEPTQQYQHQQRWREPAPRTPRPVQQSPDSPLPPSRYQSKFKNTSQPVEEKILNNIILSKLNKFSNSTYADIRDFLYQILGSGEADLAEFIRDFMRLVFRKAATEDIFCPLYAKLLTEISSKYSVILEEMKNLSDNYLEIFEEIEQSSEETYEEFVERTREKKYRLGYSQFLAELIRQEIIPLEILVATFTKVVSQIQTHGKNVQKKELVEQYTDCLLKMTKVFKGKFSQFSSSARAKLLPTLEPFYSEYQANKEKYPGCSSKIRFAMMDIHDILSNSK